MMTVIKFFIVTLLFGFFLERHFLYDIIVQYRTDVSEATIANKHVVITGASTGIGEEIAYRYAELGAKLVLTSRRQDALEKVAKKCRQLGSPGVSVVAMDMGDPKLVDVVWSYARNYFRGKVDHVILNHIGPFEYTFHDYDVSKTKWLTQVNYFSYTQMASGLLPFLELSKGSLVVISSVAGHVPVPFVTSYSGTKHALHGFFGSLRRELEFMNSNVSISFVNYGLIGSENAKRNVGGKLNSINLESPGQAAKAALRAAVAKPRDHFYPWWARSVCLAFSLMPNVLEWSEKFQYNVTAFAKDFKSAEALYKKRYLEANVFRNKRKD